MRPSERPCGVTGHGRAIDVPATAHLADGAALVLNGAGVRTKFFFDIYVGALYLEKRESDADRIVRMPGPKRIVMHYVYREVSAGKVAQGMREGFEKNLSPSELEAVRARLDRLCGSFTDVKAGDVQVIDFLPGGAVRFMQNGSLAFEAEGEDFARALIQVWLGAKPAHHGLKRAMLGLR